MDAEFIVRLMFFGLGLCLGYTLGVSLTTLRRTRLMLEELHVVMREVHACYEVLIEEGDRRRASGE